MAQSTRPGSRSEDLVDKGTEQIKKVADRVEGYASSAADQCAKSRTAPARWQATSRRPSTSP